jgi:hypothetical protein
MGVGGCVGNGGRCKRQKIKITITLINEKKGKVTGVGGNVCSLHDVLSPPQMPQLHRHTSKPTKNNNNNNNQRTRRNV